jgi:CRP/FNR family cyclic AMP-dependent transcriptional regulator
VILITGVVSDTICAESSTEMRAPYGLNILDNCLTCPVREEHLFCNLPLPAVEQLNEIKSTAIYPKSAMRFIEGQQPRGVFVLCTGKAKLSTSSAEGKTIITKISEPGMFSASTPQFPIGLMK